MNGVWRTLTVRKSQLMHFVLEAARHSASSSCIMGWITARKFLTYPGSGCATWTLGLLVTRLRGTLWTCLSLHWSSVSKSKWTGQVSIFLKWFLPCPSGRRVRLIASLIIREELETSNRLIYRKTDVAGERIFLQIDSFSDRSCIETRIADCYIYCNSGHGCKKNFQPVKSTFSSDIGRLKLQQRQTCHVPHTHIFDAIYIVNQSNQNPITFYALNVQTLCLSSVQFLRQHVRPSSIANSNPSTLLSTYPA